ncbi:MAG: glutaminyl-tRNA synthetase, partial [Pseudomonadota bacterium]
LYDRLFTVPNPSDADDWKSSLNPSSLEIVDFARVEQSLADSRPMSRYQFERVGYFCVDEQGAQPSAKVFNRVITLRDSWAKSQTSAGA